MSDVVLSHLNFFGENRNDISEEHDKIRKEDIKGNGQQRDV